MEGVKDQHFQNQHKGLAFGSLNFSDHQVLDVSSNKNADVLSQEVQNLAVKDSMNGNGNVEGGPMESKDVKHRRHYYPLRPEADNCPHFMRYGCCNFGGHCRYNHPLNRRSQANKEIMKPEEGNLNRTGQFECKYNLTPEGCRRGKACRYNHSGRKTVVAPVLEFNFLGLPVRPGEKECPYYRQNGSCKYGLNCWYDHSDPSLMGGEFSLSGYTGLEDTMPFWSLAGPVNGFGPVEANMYQPAQCAPYSEWIGYQVPFEHHEVPIYTTSGMSQSTPPPFSSKTPAFDAKSYQQKQQGVPAKESPKPNRQPKRSFKSAFGFLHPKTSSCPVNDKGLPLRPDTEVCAFYNRYGVCKHGPACRFNHPVPLAKPVPAAALEEAQLPQLPDPTTEDNN